MRKFLAVMILIVPLIAVAEYDVDKIKSEMSSESMLGITTWKRDEVGNAWLAEHTLESTVLSVSEGKAGMIAIISNQYQAISAMLNCTLLGYISTEAKDDERIGQLVTDAVTQSKQKTLITNGTVFTVYPQQVGDVVSLACTISAAKG